MTTNDGGPAFPSDIEAMWLSTKSHGDEWNHHKGRHSGMTLRDYAIVHFAAAWVIALGRRCTDDGYTDTDAAEESVRLAAVQADTMLAEREKETR